MQDELMSGAVQLSVLGMGTVLVFLGVLVLAMNLMSYALKGYVDPAPPKGQPPSPSNSGQTPGQAIDPQVQQVIALAIKKYRREHGE